MIDALADAGSNVTAKDLRNWTPIRVALLHFYNTDTFNALLRRGAFVNERGHGGSTPPHLVIAGGRPCMEAAVDVLLKWGASETALDHDGETPHSS